MSYACSYEVPATIDMYREVRRLIGDEPATGMLAHLVVRSDSGLRHLEVWESKAACQRFRENRVVPAGTNEPVTGSLDEGRFRRIIADVHATGRPLARCGSAACSH